jgi:hypothetical protein
MRRPKLMKELDYGKGYKYTPLEDSSGQEYLPEAIRKKKYLDNNFKNSSHRSCCFLFLFRQRYVIFIVISMTSS